MTLGLALRSLSVSIGGVLHRLQWTPAIRSALDIRVVFYHGIGDRRSICQRYLRDEIPFGAFCRQLDFLQDRYDVVPLEDAITQVLNRRPKRPFACITFDDGLRSVFTDAWPELRRRALPSAVFLNTAVMDNTDLLWQHHVSALASTVGPKVVLRALQLECAPEQLIPTCQEKFRELPLSALSGLGPDPKLVAAQERPYLTWDQVESMADTGLATFYSHTARHFPLASVSTDIMRREIDEAVSLLKSHNSTRTSLVSFPFGMSRDFGHALPYALTKHSYAITVGDGWNPVRRVSSSRTVGRVALEHETDPRLLYALLEVHPPIKGVLNTALMRS